MAAVLRGEIDAEEQKSANVERFLSVVERYTEIPELTPCILHEFAKKIVVYAASDPKDKNRTQEIDTYYKGIGTLEVSKVTLSRQEKNGIAEAIPFLSCLTMFSYWETPFAECFHFISDFLIFCFAHTV